jgi:hypothetical protein
MVMSETPIQRGLPPKFDRALTAHERRARLITQMHRQAIATANNLGAQHKAIGVGIAKNARRLKVVAWTSFVGSFVVALAAILALLAMME